MSEKLTTFERALLAQFETLEAACGTALESSKGTSAKLQELGANLASILQDLLDRQEQLEKNQSRLSKALDEQTRLTKHWKAQSDALVMQVNALLEEYRR